MSSTSNLKTFIGTTNWGKNLNGLLVNNRQDITYAIADLRTLNGRNQNYNWVNPVQWSTIINQINQVSQDIYGSDENSMNKLNSINITTLVVQHIGCTSSTSFSFSSMNNADSNYWAERWELYKFSYAMAVWAWGKGVTMIEFYNEPGNLLETKKYKFICLDFKFKKIHPWVHV